MDMMDAQWLEIRTATEHYLADELEMLMIYNEMWKKKIDSPVSSDSSPEAESNDTSNMLHEEMSNLRTTITRLVELLPRRSIILSDYIDLYALAWNALWETELGFKYFRVSGNAEGHVAINRLSQNEHLMTLADNIMDRPFDPTRLYRIKKHTDGVVMVELEEDDEIRRSLTPGIRKCEAGIRWW